MNINNLNNSDNTDDITDTTINGYTSDNSTYSTHSLDSFDNYNVDHNVHNNDDDNDDTNDNQTQESNDKIHGMSQMINLLKKKLCEGSQILNLLRDQLIRTLGDYEDVLSKNIMLHVSIDNYKKTIDQLQKDDISRSNYIKCLINENIDLRSQIKNNH